jgi:hypothetical protein
MNRATLSLGVLEEGAYADMLLVEGIHSRI